MEYVRTDGKNRDFIENCAMLDAYLDRRVGKKIQRDKYSKFNKLDDIKEAIVVYEEEMPVGGGAIRKYFSVEKDGSEVKTVELKRVFIRPDFQGRGIGTRLVSLLMEWAEELGYERMLLETGGLLTESCAVYRKLGFEVIPNYGPYVDMAESLCMAGNLAKKPS